MPVRFSDEAIDDLERLQSFLNDISPSAWAKAVLAINKTTKLLSENPDTGRVYAAEVRTFPVRFGKNGYVILYLVEEPDVVILRLWHGREDRP